MNLQRESNLPLALSRQARRALTSAGYPRLEQLTRLSEAEVERLHDVGPKARDQLCYALVSYDLSFADWKKANQ
jgi:hypothetical protein